MFISNRVHIVDEILFHDTFYYLDYDVNLYILRIVIIGQQISFMI